MVEKKDEGIDAYFKQFQEGAKRIREQFAPILEQSEALQRSLQPTIIEAQKSLQKTLELIFAESERWRKLVESVQIPRFSFSDISLTKPALELQKSIQALISSAFEQLQKSFCELPSRTQKALLLLGTHGWYLDLNMPGFWKLEKAFSEGNVKEAEDALVEYFESRVGEIEESISKRFPSREKLIRSAFKAHRRQEYELSIPVFLAQTDGICKEVTKQYLFRKQNQKRQIAIYIEQIAADTFRAALLSPLSKTLPIWASEYERAEGFNELNRHMVLHGESLDYGNKVNSLKAISLVNYVAHVLTLDNKKS